MHTLKSAHTPIKDLTVVAHAQADYLLWVDAVICSRVWSPSVGARAHLTSTSKASSFPVILEICSTNAQASCIFLVFQGGGVKRCPHAIPLLLITVSSACQKTVLVLVKIKHATFTPRAWDSLKVLQVDTTPTLFLCLCCGWWDDRWGPRSLCSGQSELIYYCWWLKNYTFIPLVNESTGSKQVLKAVPAADTEAAGTYIYVRTRILSFLAVMVMVLNRHDGWQTQTALPFPGLMETSPTFCPASSLSAAPMHWAKYTYTQTFTPPPLWPCYLWLSPCENIIALQ